VALAGSAVDQVVDGVDAAAQPDRAGVVGGGIKTARLRRAARTRYTFGPRARAHATDEPERPDSASQRRGEQRPPPHRAVTIASPDKHRDTSGDRRRDATRRGTGQTHALPQPD
jgi:hypothetical protein